MAKILVIGKYYPPFRGGVEAATQSLARWLARSHDVHVLVSAHDKKSGVEIDDGIVVRRLPKWGTLFNQPISRGLIQALRPSSYDLIHFHAPNPLALACLLVKMPSKNRPPIVITHHMDIYGRWPLRMMNNWMYGLLARRAALVLVTSEKNLKVSKDLPKSVRWAVVPLGLDPQAYTVSDSQKVAAREWLRTLTGDAPAVGFVGRHARYKGLDQLVGAIARLQGVHALIAGEGPYRATAEARAISLGISDRIHFLGEVAHDVKLSLLSAVDVLAFPSTEITEAFGISQLEAMFVGCPVAASNIPTGVTDLAIHEETALLSKPGDEDELARNLQRLIDDEHLSKSLSFTARERAYDLFTEERVNTIAESLIKKVLYTGVAASSGSAEAAGRGRSSNRKNASIKRVG